MSQPLHSTFARLQKAAAEKQLRRAKPVATVVVGDITMPPATTTQPNLSPDDKLPPDASLSPDAKLNEASPQSGSGLISYVLGDGTAADPRFVRHQVLAQDGHTPSEHQVYQTLWRAGATDDAEAAYRDVVLGQTAIARQASISKRNVIRILDSLHEKFSIETLSLQVSSDHTAKTYRVWSMKEILNRRRARGYAWIYRNRNVVALAKPINLSSDVSSSSDVKLTSAPGASLSPAPGVSLSPPLGTSFRKKEEELSSSSAFLAATPDFDDDAGQRLVTACRKVAPDVTLDEIAEFVERKRLFTTRKRIDNIVGFLLTAVPAALKDSGLQKYRDARAQEAQHVIETTRRQEAQSQAERQVAAKAEARHILWSRISESHKDEQGYDMQAIAADPDLDEQGREQAKHLLERLGRYTRTGL